MTKLYGIIFRALAVLMLTAAAAGCSSSWEDDMIPNIYGNSWDDNGSEGEGEDGGGNIGPLPDRNFSDRKSNVLLLYSAGFNDLKKYLTENIKDLKKGWIPGWQNNQNILLLYTHMNDRDGVYSVPSTPHLIRLYKDGRGELVEDTLVTYPEGTISSSPLQMNKVLTYVRDNYDANSYGMIFSSHATGYLPAGYYQDPDFYVFKDTGMMSRRRALENPEPVPFREPEYDPSLPMVKSVGQDMVGTRHNYISYEMDIKDFAAAIPMKLDYLLFDACFMGGIEVAYELKGKCGKLGFSQAEVLAEGFDYKTITRHLLQSHTPDPQTVCENYFVQYDMQKDVYRSATISMVDCDELEPLAEVCRKIFESHREGLAGINPHRVQRFYRFQKHWFYDLESIVIEAGATAEEIEDLHAALDRCVIYKAHTPEFMSTFDIDIFSGFSMFLPCNGNLELNRYYHTLQWNDATGLVDFSK